MYSGPKKRTQIYYHFLSKSPGKRISPRFPTGAHMERDARLQVIFTSLLIYVYLSLSVPGKGAPSMFPNRVPMDRDTPSPEPLVYVFNHSCMSAGVPKKEPSYIWGKTKSSTECYADGRPTYSGVQPGSPRGSLTTLLSLPQCHEALGTIPSTLACVDQSPVSQRVS